MKVQFQNRFYSEMPKIGIRPLLEGRMGGVRESLEIQTLQMAHSVKELIEQQLKHSNGFPVECVVPNTCISGVNENSLCNELFKKENVKATITVTPCWAYGTETMETDPLMIKAIWGFNGTERPGAVYLAAVISAHNQKGLPAFCIFGKDIQEKNDRHIPNDVIEKLLRFSKAAIAVATMRDKAYLSIGGVSMGIAGSIVNENFFQDYLGMRNEYVDMTEVLRRIQLNIYDKEEFDIALTWAKNKLNFGEDLNPPHLKHSKEQQQVVIENVVKMTLVFKDLMIGNKKLAEIGFKEESFGHYAIAAGFQGQRNWTDFLPTGDFSEAILNSSFDWAGAREPFIFATENDCLNAISMLFSHLLTGTAQIFADVRSYWSPKSLEKIMNWKPTGKAANGFIHLINSGPAALDGTGEQTINGKPAMKPFWDITKEEIDNCIKQTQFRYAKIELFSGGGYSTDYTTKGEMPATMMRINYTKNLGPVMHIAEGYIVNIPEHVHNIIDNRTDPTWPTTYFAPITTNTAAFKDAYCVMNNWGANHTSLSYGHIGADLITMASMLRIPISMHNVSDDEIFRPAMWAEFGTQNLEQADYNACSVLGPLYK